MRFYRRPESAIYSTALINPFLSGHNNGDKNEKLKE